MKNPIIPRSISFLLIAVAVLLPIGIIIVLGVGHLLSAMGDQAGGRVLDRLGLALGILWGFDLIVLVVALAVQSLDDNSRQP
ncbi:MAG: hypothetical protein JXB10_09825 [Pirellulales bacterium]|nr:hypothetical protein [Pirellulales bacterium]